MEIKIYNINHQKKKERKKKTKKNQTKHIKIGFILVQAALTLLLPSHL
jgi:hypothetical protein